MKKLLMLLSIPILVSCSSRPLKLERIDRFERIDVANIGNGATVSVSEVKYTRGDKEAIEAYIRNSGENILSTELSLCGFKVLERKQMDKIVDEYEFADSMTNKMLIDDFKLASYTVFMTVNNISLEDKGVIVPLIYNDLTHEMEVSVNIKIVNNTTGVSSYSNGNAIVEDYSKTLFLFIGDIDKDLSKGLENALKLATRDAIMKLKK